MGLMLLLLPLAVLVWSRPLVLAAEVAAVGAAVGTVDFTGVFGVIVVAQLGREQLHEHGGGGGVGPAVHLAALAG